MALQRIVKYERISSGSPSADWVVVYWNDSTNDFEVYWHQNADESGTSIQVGGSTTDTIYGSLRAVGGGPLGASQVPSVDDLQVFPLNYSYCDGTTLVQFQLSQYAPPGSGLISLNIYDFPFAQRVFTANSPSCAAGQVVCDLFIDDASIIVVTETTPSTSFDAEVTMTCETSNGPVQWRRANSVTTYDSDSSSGDRYTIQWHNKFPLANATYNFEVIDSNGCIAQKTINVASYVSQTSPGDISAYYGARWRLDNWEDLEGIPCRLDILRKNYTGATDEVKGSGEPFNILYRGEQEIKHFPLVGSEVDINLISETDMQFSSVFETDEKTHLAKIYKDYGSGNVLVWQGFLLVDLYQEPFLSAPYTVSMKFSDGLGTLKDIPFTDPSDENYTTRISYLQAITNILRKTEVGLNLRIGVNIYATGMDTTDADDPFEQLYFDPTIYYEEDGTPKDCDYVLSELLRPFGARILQAEGYWNIERVKEKFDEIPYREFTLLGEYVGEGVFGGDVTNDDSLSTSRIVQTGQSAMLSFVPGYGKITITSNLSLNNNMVSNGSFEDGLTSWTPKIESGGGVPYGVELLNNGGYSFYSSFDSAVTGSSLSLASKTFDYSKSLVADTIKFKFQYLIESSISFPYLYFDWSLKMGTYYLQADGTWSSSSGNEYNRVYSTDYNKWTDVEVAPGPSSAFSGSTIYVKFLLNGNSPYDASTIAGFKNLATTSLSAGDRRKALDGTVLRYYEIDESTDAESNPTVLRPNDYNGATNIKVWRLTNVVPFTAFTNQLNGVLLDNVAVEFIPNGQEPPKTEVEVLNINTKNTNTLDVEILHADISDDFNNAGLITKNYFTLADGTPTETWTDDDVTQPLLKHLVDDYALQYKTHLKRLNYSGLSDVVINPLKSIIETMDGSTRYMIQGMGHSHRKNEYQLEIVEHKVSAFNEPSPSNGAFDNTEFSIAFDI